MSLEAEEAEVAADDMACCASCGKAQVDDVKLRKCACNLVKYCSVDCQKNHRPQHKKACKKRIAELRDKDLFEQPNSSHLGECPICCLPMPLHQRKSILASCCSNMICEGCNFANQKREMEAGLQRRCAYCREPLPKSGAEYQKRILERVKKNCPVAIREVGKEHRDEGDYEGAFKYWTKAAELGDAGAHFELSCMYQLGLGVEKDEEKHIYHLEEAAITGHPGARYLLGCKEAMNGRFDRAKKHYIIAANLGHDDSLKSLKKLYAGGHASKEDYSDALRAYQAAVNATKSSGRERVEEAMKNGEVKQS
jgi:tetratricopeptide (TPR) repeat protein